MRSNQVEAERQAFEPHAQKFRFRPIVGPRASDEVISQVCFAIQTGAYRVGEYLPNSEELATMFNVSRPTIGDAMKILNDEGVVLPQRGSSGGLLVVSVDIPKSLVSKQKSRWREIAIDELVEARNPIEHAVAELARQRCTADDLELVRAAIDDMRMAKDRDDLSAWVNADHRFHHAVGRAAGNQVLAETLHQILVEISLVGEKWVEEFDHAKRVVRLHEHMLEALTNGTSTDVHNAVDQLLALVHDPTGGAAGQAKGESAPKVVDQRAGTSARHFRRR